MKIDYTIIDKILDSVTFFVDMLDSRIMYAEFTKMNDQPWFSSIDGETFRSFLRMKYRELADTDDELATSPIIRFCHDHAYQHDDLEKVQVSYRVAGDLRHSIEYFLADRKQQAVRVTKQGVTITADKHHKFINRMGTREQVAPRFGDKSLAKLLRPYVNLTGDSFMLFMLWLIQAFCDSLHYCLFVSAERGSGKSMLTYVISELLDPSLSAKSLLPATTDDLETLLSSQYLCTFDNVSTISKEVSDILCVAVTGGTVSRRKKFFDADMVYLPLHNILVLNGIDIAPNESDLAERSLFLTMKKLGSGQLTSQLELEQAFQADKPYILGAIFTVLSQAMVIRPSLTPKWTPRMHDAYTDMLAIAIALGITEDDFARMIRQNTAAMDKARAVDPLIEAVSEAMDRDGGRKLHGSSTEMFNKIRAGYSGSKALLPQTVATFGKKLSQLEAPLKAAGFSILLDDTGAQHNTITIIRAKTAAKQKN